MIKIISAQDMKKKQYLCYSKKSTIRIINRIKNNVFFNKMNPNILYHIFDKKYSDNLQIHNNQTGSLLIKKLTKFPITTDINKNL